MTGNVIMLIIIVQEVGRGCRRMLDVTTVHK